MPLGSIIRGAGYEARSKDGQADVPLMARRPDSLLRCSIDAFLPRYLGTKLHSQIRRHKFLESQHSRDAQQRDDQEARSWKKAPIIFGCPAMTPKKKKR
jgi:hypothetical protein